MKKRALGKTINPWEVSAIGLGGMGRGQKEERRRTELRRGLGHVVRIDSPVLQR